jgi:hypothetical protein
MRKVNINVSPLIQRFIHNNGTSCPAEKEGLSHPGFRDFSLLVLLISKLGHCESASDILFCPYQNARSNSKPLGTSSSTPYQKRFIFKQHRPPECVLLRILRFVAVSIDFKNHKL